MSARIYNADDVRTAHRDPYWCTPMQTADLVASVVHHAQRADAAEARERALEQLLYSARHLAEEGQRARVAQSMALAEARAELEALGAQAARSVAVLVPTYSDFAAIRSAKHGAIELPGGKVEEGESTLDAARREAAEELGVPVEVDPRSLGTFLHVFRGRLWLCEAFLGNIHGADMTGSAEGEATYATRAELLAGTYGPVVRRILAAYDQRLRELGCVAADVIGDRVRRGES